MLHEIIENTKEQVEQNKILLPIKLLEKSIYFDAKCVSLADYLTKKNKFGIIAEFKRKSPSKGIINEYADVVQTSTAYIQAGASALSILTDKTYFMGKNEDLTQARNANSCPILRKDFIIDEYQIIEAKSIGADVMLLIAACLEKDEVKKFYELAVSLGLSVLFEIHDKSELEKLPTNLSPQNALIGINNRNLKTMQVDVQTSFDLIEDLKNKFEDIIFISESGLNDIKTVKKLKNVGYTGFLMGEYFMKTPNPAETLKQFLSNCEF